MNLRQFTLEDYSFMVKLGLIHRPSLSSSSLNHIRRNIKKDPDWFWVAEVEGKTMGFVMGSYDCKSKIGWIHHIMVDQDQLNPQLQIQIIKAVEKRFHSLGCVKLILLFDRDQLQSQQVYETLGFTRNNYIFLDKEII